jgi:Uma2 family endonuclease
MGTKTALTWEQFLKAGKEWERWEYVDGEVKFMSPHMGGKHAELVMKICREANRFLIEHPEWIGFPTDVAFTMGSGNWRCPDWGLVRQERFGEGGVPEGPVPIPPDVAFEVISQHDTWSNIRSKRRDYQLNGVVQLWVDPGEQTVEVISPTHGTKSFAAGQTAVIEELPGFELNLFPIQTEK